MIVKLSLLDRQETLHYSSVVDVYTFNENGYERIGSCKVFKALNGDHFGDLELEKYVSHDYYFYYRCAANNAGIFIFTGLDLMPNELPDKQTTRLREMIVQ